MESLLIKILLQTVELPAGSKLMWMILWLEYSLFPLKNKLCNSLQLNSIESQSLEEGIELWR